MYYLNNDFTPFSLEVYKQYACKCERRNSVIV